LYRESNREIPFFPGIFEVDELPFREPGILRFQDTPPNPIPLDGLLLFELKLYDRRANEAIHTINWGYEKGTHGTFKH
jgi:hypothetical protein